MALTPTDMLKIQSAIDAYEKKFPTRQSPTAIEALAWQAAKPGRLWRFWRSGKNEVDGVRSAVAHSSLFAERELTTRQ